MADRVAAARLAAALSDVLNPDARPCDKMMTRSLFTKTCEDAIELLEQRGFHLVAVPLSEPQAAAHEAARGRIIRIVADAA